MVTAHPGCDGCALLTIQLEELRAHSDILHFRLAAAVPPNRPGGLAFLPIVARLRGVLSTDGISDSERVARIAAILDEVAP